jgi:heme-degrading monooxygenase HmoA
MSVIVMTKFPGPAATLEIAAKEHSDLLVRVSEEGKAAGCVHHCFVEDSDGQVLVIDEWDSEASFRAFFDNQADIPKIAAEAGVTAPPTSTAYRIIETADRF